MIHFGSRLIPFEVVDTSTIGHSGSHSRQCLTELYHIAGLLRQICRTFSAKVDTLSAAKSERS